MILTSQKIMDAEKLPVCILSSGINYQQDTFFRQATVPYTVYSDRAEPTTVLASGGTPAIHTQSVSAIISLANYNYACSAIVTDATPASVQPMRDLAKVMVASALTLGQTLPLEIKGQHPAFVLEVIKVCIASRIRHTYSQEHAALANRILGAFCFSAEDQLHYTVGNWQSNNASSAMGTVITQGGSESEVAATLDPFFTSFGSYSNHSAGSPATPPRAITRGPSAAPQTPQSMDMSFFN